MNNINDKKGLTLSEFIELENEKWEKYIKAKQQIRDELDKLSGELESIKGDLDGLYNDLIKIVVNN